MHVLDFLTSGMDKLVETTPTGNVIHSNSARVFMSWARCLNGYPFTYLQR